MCAGCEFQVDGEKTEKDREVKLLLVMLEGLTRRCVLED